MKLFFEQKNSVGYFAVFVDENAMIIWNRIKQNDLIVKHTWIARVNLWKDRVIIWGFRIGLSIKVWIPFDSFGVNCPVEYETDGCSGWSFIIT
jgi:hypothetical protein